MICFTFSVYISFSYFGLSNILNGLILFLIINKMATKIKKIPKYKLNDSNVKYLLMKDPSNEPGNSPNKKMEPFLISTCFVLDIQAMKKVQSQLE